MFFNNVYVLRVSSGVIGSGCCIFSRHPIRRAFHHKYSLNGHPHRLDQGDWLGGKLVGLAVIDIDGIELNAYVTHVHIHTHARTLLLYLFFYRVAHVFSFFRTASCQLLAGLRQKRIHRQLLGPPRHPTLRARPIHRNDKPRGRCDSPPRRSQHLFHGNGIQAAVHTRPAPRSVPRQTSKRLDTRFHFDVISF